MVDIFSEIDEDLRRERAAVFWRKNGRYVIALAVLIVLAVAGWRVWLWHTERQAQAAGALFEDAMALSDAGKNADAAKAFEDLSKTSPGGYALLSRFRNAAELGRLNAVDGVKSFDALAADGSLPKQLQDLARIRSGYLQADTAPAADLARSLEPLTAADGPWRNAAREILGLAAWRGKDATGAGKWFQAILADKDATAAFRSRAEIMLQLIAADAPAKAAS